jgi:thiamine pyrophosphokinase
MRALVIAGGDAPARTDGGFGAPDVVIAADSGVGHALALGLHVDLVVGDLDSAVARDVERAQAAGARIERHPTDKDATDLELALDTARGLGATDVTVLGAGGGRLDHLVANLLLLAHDSYADLALDAIVGDAHVTVVRSERTLDGPAGSTVTLLPLAGPAVGVTTTGLRWTLTDDELTPASTRGVSNVIESPPARVSVHRGVLLAIRPTGAS